MSNAFVIIKMCYVHNQWYDISCATLYVTSVTFAFVLNVWVEILLCCCVLRKNIKIRIPKTILIYPLLYVGVKLCLSINLEFSPCIITVNHFY